MLCAMATPPTINTKATTRENPNFSPIRIQPDNIPNSGIRYTYNVALLAPIVLTPSANHTYDNTVEKTAKNSIEIITPFVKFGIPTSNNSIPAQGVNMNKPITDDQTVSWSGERGVSESEVLLTIAFFFKIVDDAHASAAPIMRKLPMILSDDGISTFGEYMKRISTPIKDSISPIPNLFVIFSPRNGIAKRAVKIGLKVIISDASPAAVYFIPNMKNN